LGTAISHISEAEITTMMAEANSALFLKALVRSPI